MAEGRPQTSLVRFPSPASLAALAAFVPLACASDPEARDNGVNDVRGACEVRASWKNADAPDCRTCQTSAVLQRCECESLREFSGACVAQADDRRAEPSCTAALDQCVQGCAPTDCGCLDGCYATAQACRQASSARDGCVAEVCAKFCE